MNDFLKYGLLGVAAYFIYQAVTNSTATAAAAAPSTAPVTPPATNTVSISSLITALQNLTGSAPTATTAAPPPVAQAPVVNESAAASALIDAAGGVNSLNVDQWNYYTYQLGGPVLTPAQSLAIDNAAGGEFVDMDVDAYLKARAAAGLTFTYPVGVSGLGAVPIAMPLVFVYHNRQPILLLGARRAS